MVGLVRGQMADPEFGNKAREGRVEDIRLCIGCNQGCVVEGRPKCTQNLAASREATEIGEIKPADRKKRVMVIGGGPAGMEAARVAALRGHQVTLYEKEKQLGGLINTLSLAPGREEFSQVTRYLSVQLPKLGVDIRLNTEITSEMVMRENPEVVIVATGSRPYVEMPPGSETSVVASPYQVLRGEVKIGRRAVVYECTGYQEGPTVADFLAERGVQVELITSQTHIASRWGMTVGILATGNPFIWQRLKKNKVNITPVTQIKSIEGAE
jgi:NADPH-dependent 2,4-dienoyl-CoA reductase/sulfur reductase-like enzyme